MKLHITGTYGGEPAEILWEDGVLSGDEVALLDLHRLSELIGEVKVEPEPLVIGKPGLSYLEARPLRILTLCTSTVDFQIPVFDRGSAKVVAEGLSLPPLPPGAV